MRTLVGRYKNMNAPAKASLWFLFCGFLQKGIGFLTTPIFTRVMAEAQYGAFNVYTSWLSIVQIVVTLNLSADVYTRGLVKNEEDQARFSSSMMGLSTTCMVIFWLIYAAFHKLLNSLTGLSTALMAAMFLEIWGTVAYQFWYNRERVAFRYKKLAFLTILYALLRPVMGVVFVAVSRVEFQMEARVASTVLVNVLLFSVLYVSLARRGKCFYHKQYWRYGLQFTLPLLPHYLSQYALNQSDRLMINYYFDESKTAYYSVAYTLAQVLQILTVAITATMNPWIYKMLKKGEPKQIGKMSLGILVLVAAANFLVVAGAPELLRILGPESYQQALWVIPPVTASVFFLFLYNLFITFEYYYEKTRYVTAASVGSAVLNIALNIIFIPRYGFVAAGYTTLVCYMVYSLAHFLFMKKVCKQCLDGLRVYNGWMILGISLALVVGSGLMMLVYRLPLVRYGIIVCLLALAVCCRKQILNLLKLTRS